MRLQSSESWRHQHLMSLTNVKGQRYFDQLAAAQRSPDSVFAALFLDVYVAPHDSASWYKQTQLKQLYRQCCRLLLTMYIEFTLYKYLFFATGKRRECPQRLYVKYHY